MGAPGYENGFEFTLMPERLDMPESKKPTRFREFMSDLFHEKMPFNFLDQVFQVIEQTPRHSYQRPDETGKLFRTIVVNEKCQTMCGSA